MGSIGDGFAAVIISLLYVVGAVCAWIWAPWWAALVLSAPLALVGFDALCMVVSELATRQRLRR